MKGRGTPKQINGFKDWYWSRGWGWKNSRRNKNKIQVIDKRGHPPDAPFCVSCPDGAWLPDPLDGHAAGNGVAQLVHILGVRHG